MGAYKNKLISAGKDKVIRIWDYNMCKCEKMMTGHLDLIRTLDIQNVNLVSAGMDYKIKLWDLENTKLIYTIDEAHTRSIESVIFAKDFFISGSKDGLIKIWNFIKGY